jgi:asparagine synthase (glutamine-hydrolysing)
MCGIAGILDWRSTTAPDSLSRMIAALAHRGPDAEAVLCRPPIALGHRRLAVIDLSCAANQPMADETGQFLIVYNGELYNFRELRRELETAGTRFRTESDTEVLLEAYKRWDVGCLTRLNGMFAFALWDGPRQRLLLARDRAGEKPLYFQPLNEGLAFASELKALEIHTGSARRVNGRALGQYLALNYVLAPDCLVEGIEKLEPAHYLLVEEGRPLRAVRYWDLAAHFKRKIAFKSETEATEALTAQLDDAVRLRLVSDVPLGAFLSGGVDSSSIVASMCRLRSPSQNETFSIGFAEDSYDELPWARQAAAAVNVTRHHEQIVAPDMAEALPKIVTACDEPMADTSIIPVYYLAQFARRRVTVCLSGDGGDEILGGYETYVADRLVRSTRAIPAPVTRAAAWMADQALPVTFDKVGFDYKVRQFLRGHALPLPRAHFSWRMIFDEPERRALVRPELHESVLGLDPFETYGRYFGEVNDCHYLDQAMYVDIKTWLANDILVKVDRMTMAHSLESRAPFLDHRLMEFAASLEPSLKIRGRTTKYLLKRSQEGRLPDELIHRRKQGFNAPVSHWFNGVLKDLGREATTPRVLGEWFEPAAIEQLWCEHAARRRDHGFKLFSLTCLGLWLSGHHGSS